MEGLVQGQMIARFLFFLTVEDMTINVSSYALKNVIKGVKI